MDVGREAADRGGELRWPSTGFGGRNGGSPSVSVGHMSISDHAQAIVGNMTQIQGEAAPDEAAPSPPLPVDAKAVPMPSLENKEPAPVPESRARTEK